MIKILMYALAFLMTFTGVRNFRHWVLRKKIVDVPNERSSHEKPVARGGGVIIVLVSMSFYTLYAFLISGEFSYSYFFGATFIAFVSWIDDLKSISFLARFAVHSSAAALIIRALGAWTTIYIPFFGQAELGYLGIPLTYLWIVWLTNAYNFMDGIDGIAAVQAIIAGIGWFWIGAIYNLDQVGFLGAIIAASCVGFLIHNWQPAKIFMGDVGSTFLGYTFAVFPLLAINENAVSQSASNPYLPLIGLILVWIFVFDTIFTLFVRLVRFEKIWEAHRKHIYQKLVISGLSHSVVTSIYGAISVFILVVLIFWLKSDYAYDAVLTASLITASAALFLLRLKQKFFN